MTTIPMCDDVRVFLSVIDAIIVAYDNLDMILYHIFHLMFNHQLIIVLPILCPEKIPVPNQFFLELLIIEGVKIVQQIV